MIAWLLAILSAPAILAQGSLVTWAHCAAMAQFGEAAGRSNCSTEGGKTTCQLGRRDLVVYWGRWSRDLLGEVYVVNRGAVERVGEIVSPNSMHLELRMLRGDKQVASQCDIAVREDRLVVEWARK